MLDTLKCPRCDHLPQFCECGEYHDRQPARATANRPLSAKRVREMFAAVDTFHDPHGDLRQCATCGRVGVEGIDVSTAWHWQGGEGHVLRTYCREIDACFARRERQEEVR